MSNFGPATAAGCDTDPFVTSGTDAHLYTTLGNGGGSAVADVVKLAGIERMGAGDIVRTVGGTPGRKRLWGRAARPIGDGNDGAGPSGRGAPRREAATRPVRAR